MCIQAAVVICWSQVEKKVSAQTGKFLNRLFWILIFEIEFILFDYSFELTV